MARAAKYISLLGIYLAAVSAVAGAVAARRFGTEAYQASALAAFLIWVVGIASLLLLSLAKTPAARLNAALLAMLIRMALPLAAMALVMRSGGSLAAHGFAGLIVVHYLAGLVVETLLAVRIVARPFEVPGLAGGTQ